MKGFEIGKTGIWKCETNEPHYFDARLANAIVNFFGNGDILDIGCGDGSYVQYFKDYRRNATGIDGNPHLTGPDILVADLTVPFRRPADYVICLEVGEHIPAEFQDVFLDNVCDNARSMIVLSWFPHPGEGIGHVNPRPNEWVKTQMARRGWLSLDSAETIFREAAELWWFKHSLMAFVR